MDGWTGLEIAQVVLFHGYLLLAMIVVYFDQLLDAVRTQMLVELLFFSCFQTFCFFLLNNQLKKDHFEVPIRESTSFEEKTKLKFFFFNFQTFFSYFRCEIT